MTNKVPLFGELLVQLGFLSADDLQACIREAVQLSLPLGRSLVLSNKVSESDVNLTVALQSMMKIWDLPLAKAKMAVPLARKEGLSIADALARLRMAHTCAQHTIAQQSWRFACRFGIDFERTVGRGTA